MLPRWAAAKGTSTLLMAKAFPKSRFFGFDYHDKSIEAARESAKREGVAERVTFDVSKAKDFPGKDYDFVAVFDCLHDMGDPIGAASHVRQAMAKDGTWMIVEPLASVITSKTVVSAQSVTNRDSARPASPPSSDGRSG